jgi:voltage-gated potassium channel
MSKHSTESHEDRPEFDGLRRKLFIIIFEADTKLGKYFDVALLWAILISVLAVILESDSSILANHRKLFTNLEWVLTVFFTIEYVLRLVVSKRSLNYVFSFYGLIDLLSILPTYLSLIFPGTHFLMVIRVLRLLRVFRILKLVRFIDASIDLGGALKASRYKIFIFLGSILCMVLIFGTCMYIVEGEQNGFTSIPQSMYWTIVTMTTVGYGDIIPTTTLGKFVASFMMLVGYAIIAVPTGIVTSEMNNQSKNKSSDDKCEKCKSDLITKANYCHICGETTRFQ